MFRGWNDVWLDPAFRDWNLQPYLPQITCPVLMMQGEQDEYGTLHQIHSIEAAVAGPGARCGCLIAVIPHIAISRRKCSRLSSSLSGPQKAIDLSEPQMAPKSR